jgi:hypothetical protein
MEMTPARRVPEPWRKALGRFLDTRGFTVDEWQLAGLGAHRDTLVSAVQHVLERLRLLETQATLLERETLNEDWYPVLVEEFGEAASALREADPVSVAYGIRWCEILLGRTFEVAKLLDRPPEAIVQWTRDLG